jgi:hypothetical protein
MPFHFLSHLRTSIFCLALFAALPAAVTAAPASFQATIAFTEQVAPTGASAPCVLVGTISGSGVASRVGSVALASTDCINPLPPTYTTYAFASSHVVLTASNGDQIWATYAGLLSADGFISGTYFIYGGTGRFAKATGGGTVNGFEVIQPSTGSGSGELQLQGFLLF